MTVVMGKGVRRLVALVATAISLTLSGAGGYAGYVVWQGNVHPVVEGRVYRAGQLSDTALAQVLTTYHIRSILNLRGAKPGAPWYDHETAMAQAHGVAYYAYRLSARRPVTPEQLDAILHLIQTAPPPMLIHCQAGADRTGLIAAVYRFALGEGAAVAAQELSLRYGHFPYLWSQTKAMDESFAAYVAYPLSAYAHARDRASAAAGGYEAPHIPSGR